jgi:hypothetical protein
MILKINSYHYYREKDVRSGFTPEKIGIYISYTTIIYSFIIELTVTLDLRITDKITYFQEGYYMYVLFTYCNKQRTW